MSERHLRAACFRAQVRMITVHNNQQTLVYTSGEIQLGNTAQKKCWEIHLRNTIENDDGAQPTTLVYTSGEIQLLNAVGKYDSEIMLRNTFEKYSSEIQLRMIVVHNHQLLCTQVEKYS